MSKGWVLLSPYSALLVKSNFMKFKKHNIVSSFASCEPMVQLTTSPKGRVLLRGLAGSSLAVAVAGYASKKSGVNILVVENKDTAAYLANDLTELLGEDDVLFFPSAAKRSILYEGEDASSVVLRTTTLNRLSAMAKGDTCFVCTYPEAICEKVVTNKVIIDNSLTINSSKEYDINDIVNQLIDFDFVKVDFVYEPGQFSLRGGILDIFSYGENQPYRLDFFGDELESIRIFDVSTQRSTRKLDKVSVVPYIRELTDASLRISLGEFLVQNSNISGFNVWLSDAPTLLTRLDDIYDKLSAKRDDADNLVLSGSSFISTLAPTKLIYLRRDLQSHPAEKTLEFHTEAQPAFNKNFELLADDIDTNILRGYKTFILTKNKAQIERLENIFNSLGRKNIVFGQIEQLLHEGFIDHTSRCCYYTDHQLFGRFHKYKINREIKKSESIVISELNSLTIGDYVVHIDNGVAKFGGLVRSVEGGKKKESVKLIFKDNDILLVDVHSLHKISKYKDKDTEQPKLHKLGSGAWQKFKSAAKGKVKDIARDLIALYAKRRMERGYAFSPNSYLQSELEASFIYEDTPDQEKTAEAIYKDMESVVPMDRLVCGDVGYGKTEIAIRAAFKAVCDNKQVAVLVPTTVLSLQHYRTFSRRLKDFPIRVENLSRSKSSAETRGIIREAAEGKVDILIGTHKILGKDISFKDLGLLVIDEEQKFGVASKEKLRNLKLNVDTLTLTATPIPRTMQFSLMGARDLSIINTPPPNRQPVSTEVHQFSHDIIREAVELELGRNGQVFFLHNKVKNIETMAAVIQNLVPSARVITAHGQMPSGEMEKRMMDFIYGEYDVLVATTIIESGIDIPNANTIIINEANNFGLSDLHQLRGRVGRTNTKAYCYLLLPSSGHITENAARRVKAIEDFSELGSGFNIAMQDLDIRGAGNILGAEQSGFISDIGFEMYQKILNEAIAELKNEEYYSLADGLSGEKESIVVDKWATEVGAYVSDCQVDIDEEAIIPDSYIQSVNEKINLYKQIDRLSDTVAVGRLVEELRDRFGDVPKATLTLLSVVQLRAKAIDLGFEKVIVKNGYFILHFVSPLQSPYYQGEIFKGVMEYLGDKGDNFKLKPKETRLLLSIAGVKDINTALTLLTEVYTAVKEKLINNG